jgi:hypothetical protein
MKVRRLSEIDLARIAPLPREEKIARLRKLKSGRPPHSYNPFRSEIGDIFNLQLELFGSSASPIPWARVEEEIIRKSRGEAEAFFNVAVGQSLYDFALERSIRSYKKNIAPWAVGYGQTVCYWWNLYSVIDDAPCFVFVDPRLSTALTKDGRRFVLSLMHERIRVPDPDFADARLLICQFGKGDEGKRPIRLYAAEDFSLFSADELNEMIDETYRLWIEVLAERAEDPKSRPTGTTPFGF